jgi:tRNA(Ile)-lysidine synthase
VAALDLAAVTTPAGLLLQAWRALPPARQRNVLHAWLMQRLALVPGSLLDRLQQELKLLGVGRWPAGGGELRLYRGLLSWSAQAPHVAQALPLQPPLTLQLNRVGVCQVEPWQGHFVVSQVHKQGVSPSLLQDVLLLPRTGGERFALGPKATPRSLKKQFQAAAVAAWQREAPLVCTPAGRLLFVPGLGFNGWCQAAEGQAQLGLRWVPDEGGAKATEPMAQQPMPLQKTPAARR